MRAGRGLGAGYRRPIWRALVPVIALAAGVLFATSAETAKGTDLRAGRRVELTQLIAAQERSVGDATRRAVGLQAEVDVLEQEASTKDGRVGAVRAESDRLENQVGLRPIRGGGLTVVLDDAPRRPDGSLPPDARPDDVIVHQQDVQSVVNALWAGGADGLMVMGQRLITTGAVRCVGNTLLLYGRTYSPPFRVTAIGDPVRLHQALAASEGVRAFREAAADYGLGYRETVEASVVLPAYEGSGALHIAKVPE